MVNGTSIWGSSRSVAKFIFPDWGDKVNTGIGVSYRPDRLHGLAGWSHLYPPVRDYEFGYNIARISVCVTRFRY